MLASLAEACEGRALGVILSGMGRDGVIGAKSLVDAGGTIYAQDADTSAVWGMPGAAARAGLASMVAPPERLGDAVMAQASAPSAPAAPALR
jgi:two-component system chemotaxis response regulator CheB